MLVLAGRSSTIKLLKTSNKADSNWKNSHEIPIDDKSGSEVSAVAWAPTRSLLALCGKKWEHISILNCDQPDNQSETRIAIPGGRYQNCCVFNKTGKYLATAGVGGSVYIWTENTGTRNWEQVTELHFVTMTTVTTISWDPSDQYICTGDTRGHVTLRERLSNNEYREGVELHQGTHSEEISALTCNPHHPFQPPEVAVGHSNGVLEVWDILSRTVRFTLHSHSTTVTDIAYSTINGLLLATAGLDGEIHIVLLKSGTVVKKCSENRPIHSLEFIKGTQKLVFLTQSELVTFRLNKKWSEREREPHHGAQIVRHQTSRGPLYESQEAFVARSPSVPTSAAGIAKFVEIVKNKPAYQPSKPSPEEKGIKDLRKSDTPGSLHDIQEKSTIMSDKESSFNISDLVNYTTDENSNTPRVAIHRVPSIQKRSADGNVLAQNVLTPDSNTENTPSRTDDNSPYSENLRNKLRRIAVEDGKENRPPGIKVTPQDLLAKTTGRLVSSTPAVTNSNKQHFLTPTSHTHTPQSSSHRSPLTQVQRFKNTLQSTKKHNPLSSTQQSTTLQSPNQNSLNQHSTFSSHSDSPLHPSLIKKSRQEFSVSSLISSVGNSPVTVGLGVDSPVTDPSSLGPVSQEKLSVHFEQSTENRGQGSSFPASFPASSANLTPGGAMSNEQMSILQNQITEHFKGLEKTLLSETRWLKNEVVRQAVDTQFALEDVLAGVTERQNRIEQRLVDMEHNITTIMRNM